MRGRGGPTRLRTAAGAALATAAALLGLGGAWLCESRPVAWGLGPHLAGSLGDLVQWGLWAWAASFALRFLATRRPGLAPLEAAVLALALAAGVAAHRHGMTYRPLVLSDWSWSRGIDPATVLLGLGAAAGLAAALLLVEERRTRTLAGLLVPFALLALLLLLAVRQIGAPTPPLGGGVGLTRSAGHADTSARRGGPAGGSPAGHATEDVEFRDQYAAGGGQVPVAVVLFDREYTPPSGVYYFRQTAFSQYNGRRLVQATTPGRDGDLIERFPTEPVEIEAAPALSEQRREVETTIALVADHVRPFALDAPAAAWPAGNPDPNRFRRAYGIRSHVLTRSYGKLLQPPVPSNDPALVERRHYTEHPTDPRYAELAQTARGALTPELRANPLAQAWAVKRWLEENGIYSRTSHHADAGDPTASFLFGDRTGYCVHFAHAAVFLLRTLGIPARVAAGYAVAARRRGKGSALLIADGDAHVWPEIHLAGVGWVVMDIAPEQSLEPPAAEPDAIVQQALGEAARQSGPATDAEQHAADTAPAATERAWRPLALAIPIAAALAALGAYAIKLYRWLVPRLAGPRHLYRVAYRAAADRLAEVGYRRRTGESRERFAARVGDLAPSFGALTWAHLGPPLGSATATDPAALRRLLARTGREIRSRVPIWQIALGTLNPFAWLGTR